jgi:hypothetical protein
LIIFLGPAQTEMAQNLMHQSSTWQNTWIQRRFGTTFAFMDVCYMLRTFGIMGAPVVHLHGFLAVVGDSWQTLAEADFRLLFNDDVCSLLLQQNFKT